MKSNYLLLLLLPCILSFEGDVDYADQTTWEGVCTTGQSQSTFLKKQTAKKSTT